MSSRTDLPKPIEKLKQALERLSFSEFQQEGQELICDDAVATIYAQKELDDLEVERLRKKALVILENDLYNSAQDSIYQFLLALTELRPINLEDPVTLERIPSEKVVYVSTGHQFNIDSMAQCYKHSDFKNLLANKLFSIRDQEHIKNIAKSKNIKLNKPPKQQNTLALENGFRAGGITALGSLFITLPLGVLVGKTVFGMVGATTLGLAVGAATAFLGGFGAAILLALFVGYLVYKKSKAESASQNAAQMSASRRDSDASFWENNYDSITDDEIATTPSVTSGLTAS